MTHAMKLTFSVLFTVFISLGATQAIATTTQITSAFSANQGWSLICNEPAKKENDTDKKKGKKKTAGDAEPDCE